MPHAAAGELMPRLRHKAKARTGFTDAMLSELAHGIHGGLDHEEPTYPGGSVFESALARRGAWITYRELVEAECKPLARADTWWEFETKKSWWEFDDLEPEWPISLETLALERIGELTPAELGLLEATRRDRAERTGAQARRSDEYETEKAKSRRAPLLLPQQTTRS